MKKYKQEAIDEIEILYPNLDEVSLILFETIERLVLAKKTMKTYVRTPFLYVDDYEEILNKVENIRLFLVKLVIKLQKRNNEIDYLKDIAVLDGLTENQLSSICNYYNYSKERLIRMLIKSKIITIIDEVEL